MVEKSVSYQRFCRRPRPSSLATVILMVAAITLAMPQMSVAGYCGGGVDYGQPCSTSFDCRKTCSGGVDTGKACLTASDCRRTCAGGIDVGKACTSDSTCRSTCSGGSRTGQACTSYLDCPGGGSCLTTTCLSTTCIGTTCVGGFAANNLAVPDEAAFLESLRDESSCAE